MRMTEPRTSGLVMRGKMVLHTQRKLGIIGTKKERANLDSGKQAVEHDVELGYPSKQPTNQQHLVDEST